MYYWNGCGDRHDLPERRLEPVDCYGPYRRACPECGLPLEYGEICDRREDDGDEH